LIGTIFRSSRIQNISDILTERMSHSYDVRKSKYLKKMISPELSVAQYLIKIHFAGN